MTENTLGNPARFCGSIRFSNQAVEYDRATAIFGSELNGILATSAQLGFTLFELKPSPEIWKASFRYKQSIGTASLGASPIEAALGALLLALDHQTWIESNPAADPLSIAGQRRLQGRAPAKAKTKLLIELSDLFPEGF